MDMEKWIEENSGRGQHTEDFISKAKLRELLKDHVVVPKWSLIDTAPKEIEFRCLLAHEYSTVTGYWDGRGWVNERGGHTNPYFQATHWMPLPILQASEKEA